jgi:hypothetical protein
MTDVYIVIIEDRHSEPDAEPFSSQELAIMRAGQLVARYAAGPEDMEWGLTDSMIRNGWVWYCRYSMEGDSIRVVRREMDKLSGLPLVFVADAGTAERAP